MIKNYYKKKKKKKKSAESKITYHNINRNE